MRCGYHPHSLWWTTKKTNILGRNLLPKIGMKQVQEEPQNQQILNKNEEDKSNPEIKHWVEENFAQLFVRTRKAKKNHIMKTQFLPDITPIQEKGRRFPIHLQERVKNELNILIDQKHNIKLDKFISPIVKTVGKNETVNLAFDSMKINKIICENKHQMPNISLLLDKFAQTIKSDKNEQTLFTSMNLRYAYSQNALDKKTREKGNFSLTGGNTTGKYQFQRGFYGLTDILAELQNSSRSDVNKLQNHIRLSR